MATHTKPPIVCYLKPGSAVGAHKDFAATFNWIVDWVWNFRVGDGLQFEHDPDSAHPKVSMEDGGSGGGGGVKIAGTDGTEHTGSAFAFSGADYSNVSFSVEGDGTIKVGVYYA